MPRAGLRARESRGAPTSRSEGVFVRAFRANRARHLAVGLRRASFGDAHGSRVLSSEQGLDARPVGLEARKDSVAGGAPALFGRLKIVVERGKSRKRTERSRCHEP